MNPIQSMMVRATLAGCFAVGVAMSVRAQISEGGTPPSFRYEQTLRNRAAAERVAVNFNVDDEKLVDAWRESEERAPRCVSKLIEVKMNPNNAGAWNILPDGQVIWQLEIEAEGAQALMLYYADFLIPEGGRLYLYNRDKSELLGAYTHATHPGGGRFATGFISGEAVTLEYAPGQDGRRPQLEIEAVGYGYNLPEGDQTWRQGMQLRRASGSCEVNVNCSEGDAWQNEKRGVCHIMQRINGKGYICSGSLVNNTAQDLKPYILTATHCAQGASSEVASDADLLQWQFIFHKEYTGCRNGQTEQTRSMVGCTRVASTPTNGGSDGLLLLLKQSIPENYNVYYNGWDRSDRASASGVSMHFPQGDYMKISTYTAPVSTATFYGEGTLEGAPHAHWDAIFARTVNGHGVTEVGSSGAPLFNSDRRIVGTLTGGTSSCTRPDGSNLFGKLSYHWDKQKGDAAKVHFDRYLDPKNSGVQVLDGRYHRVVSAPTNLRATRQEGSVKLTWAAPASGTPRTYRVFRNQTNISETASLTYTDASPGQGTIVYGVSAVYDGGSESSMASVTVEMTELKAPTDVKVTRTTDGHAAVLWNAPVYEQSIYWGGSRARNQVNVNNTGESRPFYFGQRWEPSDLTPLDRRTITAVRFTPTRDNTYEVYIAQGSRVYTQKITQTYTYGTTNTVTLTTPFTIDASEALTVAIYASRLSTAATNFPAVCDEGPAIDGKGDLYSFDGHTWQRLHTGSDAAKFNYNFFLSAIVSSRTGSLPASSTKTSGRRSQPFATDTTPHLRSTAVESVSERAPLRSMQPYAFPEVTGYTIYRDRTKLATVGTAPTRYTDPTKPTHTVSYQVAAVYGNHESAPSAAVSFTPMANVEADAAEPAIYPNPFGDGLTLSGAERVSRIEFIGADGRLLLKQDNPGASVDTHALPVGVCLIRLTMKDNSQRTLRGIKH